ncbi:hypothetical protein Tco_1002671 [Tanacetum coccineum]|uniref:Uncharacterized protein n=1 Tax=Tanacetum coccineum TaxID=301880 RepID=A0ABQ5F892_9ASTR
MTTPITTTTCNSQMHKDIMAADQLAEDDSPEVQKQTVRETFLNISTENKAHHDAEAEAIHLILTRIGDDIYSTVDACKTARDMWVAIERLQQARNANPLALVAATQQYPDTYYQSPKSHKSYVLTSIQSSLTRSHETTRNKGKEIAKPITPPSESASEEDSDLEQAQRDKDINKSVDSSPRQRNEFQTRQFGNQRTVTVARDRESVGSQAQDYNYHKEKMLLCKQAEKGVLLCAEQTDWLDDTEEELDDQELEAHYIYMEKIQEFHTTDSGPSFDAEPLKKVDNNVIPDSSYMCNDDTQADQNAEECDDERVMLANLITNLKLNTDENKKIQKQLKKANASLPYELHECKSALEK